MKIGLVKFLQMKKSNRGGKSVSELKIGKLESQLLEKLVFDSIVFKRKETLVRAGIGEDCAVVDYGDEVCVISTDPITGATNEIGKLAIHISCNDIASNGIEPVGIMLAVMMPEGTTKEEIKQLMEDAGQEAKRLKVDIIGGHTEITNAVNKTVIVSTAIGKIKKRTFNKDRDIEVGDAIILTKNAGLEGTAIIATDHEETLKRKLNQKELQRAKDMFRDLSVVKEGVIAGSIGFSKMHDVTEGGVLGAVWELCRSAKKGATVYYDAIDIAPETLKICDIYKIDPLKLISSGSMLIVANQDKKEKLLKAFEEEGIRAQEIGKVTEGTDVLLYKDNQTLPIDPPKEDALYEVK